MDIIRESINKIIYENEIISDDDIEYYSEGECGAFAEALHRMFNSFGIHTTLCVISDPDDVEEWEGFDFAVTHVAVCMPNDTYIDIRGIQTLKQMGENFDIYDYPSEYEISSIWDIMGDNDDKPIYGNEQDIQKAINYIKANWLPVMKPHLLNAGYDIK